MSRGEFKFLEIPPKEIFPQRLPAFHVSKHKHPRHFSALHLNINGLKIPQTNTSIYIQTVAFPPCEYFRSALMSSGAARISDGCHRSRAWLTTTALSGVRFDFPLADRLDFWDLFLRTIPCLLSYVLMCTGAESQPRCRTIQFAWWEQHVSGVSDT